MILVIECNAVPLRGKCHVIPSVRRGVVVEWPMQSEDLGGEFGGLEVAFFRKTLKTADPHTETFRVLVVQSS